MTLSELLDGLNIAENSYKDWGDRVITGMELDSRKVSNGDVFIALSGTKQHGLKHFDQALINGVSAVLFEPTASSTSLAEQIISELKITNTYQSNHVPVIAVEGLADKLGPMAAKFYKHPAAKMDVIGITGTNGKTSCSQFLAQALEDCGIIGTLGWGQWGGSLNKTLNTTPDALAIQKILAELLKQGKRTVAMEVSSHGLAQGRLNGVEFKGAVFTNISRDHLDYHETMDAYLEAKLKLLTLPGLAFSVVNLDDSYSEKILAAVPEHLVLWGFSVKGSSHLLSADFDTFGTLNSKQVSNAIKEIVFAENLQHNADGMQFEVCWRGESQSVNVPLYGDFNVENVLAVLAVMLALGFSLCDAAKRVTRINPVMGRMERLGDTAGPLVFVDYAHTPDALDKVLSCAKQHTVGDLWVVFGCGGNRDAGKRPLMGSKAECWADHVVVTDDNPRDEDGQDIIDDILAGCSSTKIEVIRNREQAIQKVIEHAGNRDCIVIAGKGHEQYQEIEGARTPFSDSKVAVEALRMRFKKLSPESASANDVE